MQRNPEENFEQYRTRREGAALLLKRILRGVFLPGTVTTYVPKSTGKGGKTKRSWTKAKARSVSRRKMAKESRRKNRA